MSYSQPPGNGRQPGPHGPGYSHAGGPQQGYAQPGYPQQSYPQQRAYDQSRYAPAVAPAMRVNAPVVQYQGGPVQAGWTAQAWNAQPQHRPSADPAKDGADIARLVVAIIATVLLGIGLLLILLIAGISLRGVGIVVVFLSALPLTFIVGMVWWFDRWKSRPKLLLALCVLWGAVAAVVGVLVFQTLGVGIAGVVGIDLTGDTVGAVVLAPLFEESFKGVFLVAVVLAARKYFEGPLDGWVYGSLIGAGFAFTENLLYLGQSFAESSAVGLVVTFLMRCLMSPLLHSTFVMCAGVTIGWAARRGHWWLCIVMWLPGLLGGMVLHGLWNGTASLTQNFSNGVLALGLIVLVSVLISALWFGMGLFLRSEEAKNTRHALGDYANAGWLTHEEVTMLGTWAGRRAGRAWARRYPGGIEPMRRMIALATELASIRVRLLAGVGGVREPEAEAAKLHQFASQRGRLMECAQVAQAAQQAQGAWVAQQAPGAWNAQVAQPAQAEQYAHGVQYAQGVRNPQQVAWQGNRQEAPAYRQYPSTPAQQHQAQPFQETGYSSAYPQAQYAATSHPESHYPQAQNAQAQNAYGRATHASNPQAQYPDGQNAHGQGSPGQYAPGQFTPEQSPSGQGSTGQHVPAQPAPGQYAPGQFAPGQFTQAPAGSQGAGWPQAQQPAHQEPPAQARMQVPLQGRALTQQSVPQSKPAPQSRPAPQNSTPRQAQAPRHPAPPSVPSHLPDPGDNSQEGPHGPRH